MVLANHGDQSENQDIMMVHNRHYIDKTELQIPSLPLVCSEKNTGGVFSCAKIQAQKI